LHLPDDFVYFKVTKTRLNLKASFVCVQFKITLFHTQLAVNSKLPSSYGICRANS